jgi:2-polyprenyl-3-methyl-5-hydroxy-6-metoxy-1,4-benzoquinol methylase
MSTEKRNFDAEAASWDEHPARVKLAGDVAQAIEERCIVTSGMDAMDFGCGTGLLTLRLQPQVRSIMGIDSSPGMLDVLQAKIGRLKLDNVRTQLVDLDRGDRLEGRYDLIASSMTLHHIRDARSLFERFHSVLTPGGFLCAADLDSEGGRFHEDNTGVFHFGFDRSRLRQEMMDAGFCDVVNTTAAEVVKPASDGQMRRFTIFLITARK